MKTEIFMVTHAKHFPWLIYCLRSIDKFATGFAAVRILVPTADLAALQKLVSDTPGASGIPIFCLAGDEWPGQGMVWHEAQILRADHWCPTADFIAHFDPDCIFTGPVTPETFIVNGRPILRFENFRTIGVRHPGVLRWKEAAEKCLPFPVDCEFMRGHPEVYHRGLYAQTRYLIAQKTGQPCDDYIRSCRNEFPQTFCEFCTLGAVACQYFRELYQPFDCATQPNPDMQDYPVQQFWSHGAIGKPQEIWVRGQVKEIVPLDMIKQFGLA